MISDRWRAEFEALGYSAVRDDVAQGGYRVIGGPPEKLAAAREWLKEQDEQRGREEVDRRDEHRRIGVGGVVLTFIGIVVAVLAWLAVR